MTEFVRPKEAILEKSKFSGSEVGVTHPSLPSFIRLADNGDIEIMAAEGFGLILHAANRSITILADSVKMITKEDGLRWNSNKFNPNATNWTEPALLEQTADGIASLYDGVDYFTSGD